MSNSYDNGDRVKRTVVKIHDPDMPHITSYGTVTRVLGDFYIEVTWDDGSADVVRSEGSGIFPIDTKLRHPEPIAYRRPNHWQEAWSTVPWREEKEILDRVAAEMKEIAKEHPVQIIINGKIYP